MSATRIVLLDPKGHVLHKLRWSEPGVPMHLRWEGEVFELLRREPGGKVLFIQRRVVEVAS